MKIILSAFIILLIGVTAQASWSLATKTIDGANETVGFDRIKTKYGRSLKRLSPADWHFMSSIEVVTLTYEWIGSSQCPAGSPDLTIKAMGYGYTLSDPQIGHFSELDWDDPYFVNYPTHEPCK
jgi:hypothetical protein